MNTLPSSPAPAPPPARRTHLRGVLAALGVVLLVLFALAVLALVSGIGAIPDSQVQVTINGEPLVGTLNLAALPPAHKVVLAAVIAATLLAMLVLVPMAVLVAALAALLAVAVAVGLALLAAGLAVAVVASPLLLIGWLLWLAFRRRPPPSPTIAA